MKIKHLITLLFLTNLFVFGNSFKFKIIDPFLVLNADNSILIDPIFNQMCQENASTPEKLGFEFLNNCMIKVFGKEKIINKDINNISLLKKYDNNRLYVRGILSTANISKIHKAGIITDYYLRATIYLEVLNLATGEVYYGTSQTGISIAKISDDIQEEKRNSNLKRLFKSLYEKTIEDLVSDMKKNYSPGKTVLTLVDKIKGVYILSKGSKYGVSLGEMYLPENKNEYQGVFKIIGIQPEFSHAEWLGDKTPPEHTQVIRSGGNNKRTNMLKILPMGGKIVDEKIVPDNFKLNPDLNLSYFYSRLTKNENLYLVPPLSSLDLQQENEANQGDIGEMAIRGQREWPDLIFNLKILYMSILPTDINKNIKFTYKVGVTVDIIDFNNLLVLSSYFNESQIEEVYKPGLVEFEHKDMFETTLKNAIIDVADKIGNEFKIGRINAVVKDRESKSSGTAVAKVGKVTNGMLLNIYNMGKNISYKKRSEPFYKFSGRIKIIRSKQTEFDFMSIFQSKSFKKGSVISGLENNNTISNPLIWKGLSADSKISSENSSKIIEELIQSALMETKKVNFVTSSDPDILKVNDIIKYQGKFAVKKQNLKEGDYIKVNSIKAKVFDFPETENSLAVGVKLSIYDHNNNIIKENGIKQTRTFSLNLSKKKLKALRAGKLVTEKLNKEKILYNRYMLIREIVKKLEFKLFN